MSRHGAPFNFLLKDVLRLDSDAGAALTRIQSQPRTMWEAPRTGGRFGGIG